jgi:ClpP protease-like protein
MDVAASIGSDPRFPGFPPEVPFPPSPGPEPPRPGYPPVPMVPMPGTSPTSPPADDLRSRVYDDLLARRTVVLDRALDAETATLVAAQLMSLDSAGTDPITLVVNSPGGPLDAAAAVLDTMTWCAARWTRRASAGRTAPPPSWWRRAPARAAWGPARKSGCGSRTWS